MDGKLLKTVLQTTVEKGFRCRHIHRQYESGHKENVFYETVWQCCSREEKQQNTMTYMARVGGIENSV
jgi:hypothetical protein